MPGSTSVTRPFSPSVPSSVVIETCVEMRLASSAPNSRPSVAAPSTKSTRQPRPRSCSASVNSGALPYPPPTRVAVTGSRGRANGRPSGPTTSTGSCARRPASQAVPFPWTEKTISTVPP